jgi:hypothetical protein
MGPAWDYDLAWGNANYCEVTEQAGWIYEMWTVCPDGEWQSPFWWDKLMTDSVFVNELACRWKELSSTCLQFDSLYTWINSQAVLLDEAQQRNFTKWPILGVWIWPNPWPLPETYHEEVVRLQLFAMQRLSWLNAYMPGNCNYASVPETPLESPIIFPNPVKDILHISIPSSAMDLDRLEICNSFGQVLQSVNLWQKNIQVDMSPYSPGIYFLKIYLGNEVLCNKIIKVDHTR